MVHVENSESLSPLHSHRFLAAGHEKSERKSWAVIWLCGLMMIAEIVGGLLFGSIALVADGLHMSTHAGALLLAALAYTYARNHADAALYLWDREAWRPSRVYQRHNTRDDRAADRLRSRLAHIRAVCHPFPRSHPDRLPRACCEYRERLDLEWRRSPWA